MADKQTNKQKSAQTGGLFIGIDLSVCILIKLILFYESFFEFCRKNIFGEWKRVDPLSCEPKSTSCCLSVISALVNQCYDVGKNESATGVIGSKG